MKTCKIVNCDKKYEALGYCDKHYKRFRKYGDPLYIHPKHNCKVVNCDKKHKALGYCSKHYQKYKLYGDPLYINPEKHDMCGTPEYETWHNMIQRCHNKKATSYERYGGRGITVCERWRKSFKNFYEDMGLKPFPEAQIDRIDNDGDYKLSNCRWVTLTENIRNSSKTKLSIEIAREIRKLAVKMTVIEIAKLHKTRASSVRRIIKNQMWKESIA